MTRLDKIKDLTAKLRRVSPSARTDLLVSAHQNPANQTPRKAAHTILDHASIPRSRRLKLDFGDWAVAAEIRLI